MKARVVYYSVTGNTRKVAESIAQAVGVTAESIGTGTAPGEAEVLFIGAAVYATHDHGLHPVVKKFIAGLNGGKVKQVAVFATGFIQSDAVGMLKSTLQRQGIKVADESYFCKGRFALFNLGHPGEKDLEAAADFARKITGPAPRRD
ncbi:MAG TPA: flavodoxin family protein [bacterium]|nr:flavodoxin family protein [bacterium]